VHAPDAFGAGDAYVRHKYLVENMKFGSNSDLFGVIVILGLFSLSVGFLSIYALGWFQADAHRIEGVDEKVIVDVYRRANRGFGMFQIVGGGILIIIGSLGYKKNTNTESSN